MELNNPAGHPDDPFYCARVAEITSHGNGSAFLNPQGSAVSAPGMLYILDTGHDRVVVKTAAD
jgi:hypothetical protein